MTFWHVKLIDVEGSGCWQLKYWFYYYYWRSKPTLIKPSLGRRTRTHTHTHAFNTIMDVTSTHLQRSVLFFIY